MRSPTNRIATNKRMIIDHLGTYVACNDEMRLYARTDVIESTQTCSQLEVKNSETQSCMATSPCLQQACALLCIMIKDFAYMVFSCVAAEQQSTRSKPFLLLMKV